MTQIGQFTRCETGFVGTIRTLLFDRRIAIIATTSDNENTPDYRIHLGSEDGAEIGAAWNRASEKAGDYLSLVIDDPAFPQPIHAALFRSPDDPTFWTMHWTRPSKRDERG